MATSSNLTNGNHIENGIDEKPSSFKFHNISKSTRKLLKENGYKELFPVQYETYRSIFEGRDTLVQARTGTGKTLAFVLPLIEKLRAKDFEKSRKPIIIVLAPTRELVMQITRDFKMMTEELRVVAVYGGVPYQNQISDIERGSHVIVGAPGRVLDLTKSFHLELSGVEHVILDEADQLLERGFTEDIEKILSYTNLKMELNKTQFLMFSATLPSWVETMAEQYMSRDHIRVDLIGSERVKTSTTVDHKAIRCPYTERHSTIGDVIQVYSSSRDSRVMVFCPTKVEANELALSSCIKISSQLLHGDIPQKQREVTLEGFRRGAFQCLVTTDVAARGLDIPEVDLVVQCEPPKDIHAYIHRAGRTGRAGRQGVCIIFYKAAQEFQLKRIESVAGIHFKKIGAPQPTDLIKSCSKEAGNSLNKIPTDIVTSFKPYAEELITKVGAVECVARAIAYISGYSQMETRSLLSGQKDFCAIQLKINTEARFVGFFWGILRRYINSDTMDNIKGMRMCEDRLGCVFDVPLSAKDSILTQLSDMRHGEVTVLSELPSLVEIKENTASWGKRRPDSRFNSQDKRPRMEFKNNRGRGPNRFSNRYSKNY
ncbi:hypothetical protein LOD99_6949 [Oopsacas minuta]|uniref:RNA helicase n=1 Tax=Oopsacas minuta TaxID=111878 RepID=A0AAV7JKK4_9METZ|nr:hypothetical protein LOD99_6949 [Oopsacas minuta]